MKNDTKVLNSRLEALQEIRSRWVIVENRDESLSHILQLLREAGTLEYTGSEWVIVENETLSYNAQLAAEAAMGQMRN